MPLSFCVCSIQESLEDCKERLGEEKKSSQVLQKHLEEKQVRAFKECLWMCVSKHAEQHDILV